MSVSTPKTALRVAVLVSGRGSNLRALLEAKRHGRLPLTEFAAVVSNQPDAPALEVAERFGVPTFAVDHKPFGKDRASHEERIVEILREQRVDAVILAGYMRLLVGVLLKAFPNRVINIHPSLLPAFPGTHAQRQAVEYGVKFSGCTVHFVTEEMDAGPIILQRIVPVHTRDTEETLGARVLVEEHVALPFAVDLLSRDRLQVVGRHVDVLPGESSFPELEGSLPSTVSLLIATGNAHKLQEISDILHETSLTYRSTKDFGFFPEPEENAPDYLGNALIKARVWQQRSGLWTLADDSGLEVDALDGRPGVHSARYAATAEERISKLLGELEGVPPEKRRARFVCAIALCGPGGSVYTSEGVLEGQIALETKGNGGFGYDPIFIPDGFGGAHLAELSEETKNNISHRARALFQIKPQLELLSKGKL